jgi:competence protein ComEA
MIRTVIAVLLAFGLGVTTSAEQESSRKTSSSPPASASASASAPINLNTASVAQLETLPGIGRSTAERILEYRQKNGSFKKIEDLMNVRGVGEKSFLKLKPLITVAPVKGEQAGQ